MKACRFCTNSKTEQWGDKKKKIYNYCSNCGIIQMEPAYFLSPGKEKARYLRHNNTPENKKYIAYLQNFIDTAIIPNIKPKGEILDFGSGPIPTLSYILKDLGFSTQLFDPIFNNITNWENRSFDAIIAVEVFEHLHNPKKVIPLIQTALKPEGTLILRTLLQEENYSSFMKWWYREDRTHVSFYSKKTIEYICSKWSFDLIQIENNCKIILKKKNR